MNLDPLLLDYWLITAITFNAHVPPPPHPYVGLPDPQVPLFGHYGARTPARRPQVPVGSFWYLGLSENSVPLNPLVNDHYPY